MTYAFTSNADGSKKLPPFIIGKAAKPRAFNKKSGTQLGFYYRNNAKAWMTASLYEEWICAWDRELQAKRRKVLLLQDNFSGHIIPDNLQNIEVRNFAPNLTAHIQPMDQGIIQCFKAHYRTKYIRRAVDHYEAGVTPSQIYELDQLEAMRLAHAAWQDVDTTTIRNCWRKAGILPTSLPSSPSSLPPTIPISSLISVEDPVEDFISEAERELADALDDLEATGALQPSNRMSIKALLNPPDESSMMDETTDFEIFQAVMEARKERESDGDDESDAIKSVDLETVVKPRRTCKEALQASLIMQDFLQELNTPYARSLEAELFSFGHQTRHLEFQSMKSTHITDYFVRK